MSLFVIADLHLPFGVNKPMDIFGGWDNYVQRLEYNWKSVVKPEDTVVIPGDFCWALKLQESLEDFKFLESLPGQKIMSKGNHDLWWSSMKKNEDFVTANGFTSVKFLHNNCYAYGRTGICGTRGWISENGEPADLKVLNREAGRLETSISAAKAQGLEPIVFLHYPPVYIHGDNEPMLEVLRRHGIKQCFYGHIHGKEKHSMAIRGVKDGIEYHLVSADYLQFLPLDITKFVQSDE